MTKSRLEEYLIRERRINRDLEAIAAMERAAEPGAATYTGMPRRAGTSDRVGDLACAIADAKTKLEQDKKWLEEERREIIAWMRTLEDLRMSAVVLWHYIRGKSWEETADALGAVSADAIKIAFSRLMRRYEQT